MVDYIRNGDNIKILKQSETGNEYSYPNGLLYRVLIVACDNGVITNGSSNAEAVTISVVDGLEVARGTDPEEATVLDYDGDVTLTIDGVETTKTLSNGTVSFDVTTDKPAGSTIKVEADSLTDHPSESDSVEIEVVSQ